MRCKRRHGTIRKRSSHMWQRSSLSRLWTFNGVKYFCSPCCRNDSRSLVRCLSPIDDCFESITGLAVFRYWVEADRTEFSFDSREKRSCSSGRIRNLLISVVDFRHAEMREWLKDHFSLFSRLLLHLTFQNSPCCDRCKRHSITNEQNHIFRNVNSFDSLWLEDFTQMLFTVIAPKLLVIGIRRSHNRAMGKC